METQSTADKKSFFQNDRLLVCSMLVFYGVCMLGCVAAIFWGLNRTNQTISIAATSTASINATKRAIGTATAIARETELAHYELIDTFDSNINRWRTGSINNDYWKGSSQVTSGVYIWYVKEVKKGFVDWADFPGNDYIKNYDVYVDTKFEEASLGNVCSGLIFRKSPLGWNTGGYSFVICKAGLFSVYYHDTIDGWQKIKSEYDSSIQPLDWNRLEVLVYDSHFVFLINSQVVYETDDDRQPTGGVALMIDADNPETKILFDNFGYQTR